MKVRLNQDGTVRLLQNSGELVKTKDSVSTCSALWFVYPFSRAEESAPVVGKSPHPVWSGLYCKSVSIKRHGGGALISAVYEGAEFTWNGNSDSNENTIEISATMREEPIETHPDFKKKLAGTPLNPINGAIFDDDGKFTGWSLNDAEGNNVHPLAGVKSYLVPGYSATVTHISRGRPGLGGIGYIGGGGGLPPLEGGRQWMKTGISYSSLADGTFRVTETYLSSAEGGWSKLIYK